MQNRLLLIFSLAPIFRGFIALCLSGAAFPLCGIMVLRLNLVTMRYMLMHGVILGGAISLAANLPLIPATIFVNLLLVLFMFFAAKDRSFGFSGETTAAMIFSMAFASIIMHITNVPAKDTLSLLWGSPFVLSKSDLTILILCCIGLTLYIILNFKIILSLFFNIELAQSFGINVKAHYSIMVLIIAIVVSIAMKLLGAFLVDSLLILPVLISSISDVKKSGGIKRLFIKSSILGFVFAVSGYITAVLINWPPAATISFFAGIVYILLSIIFKFRGLKHEKNS